MSSFSLKYVSAGKITLIFMFSEKLFSGKMLLKCLNNAYHFRLNKMLKESGVLTQRFLEDWFNSGTALLMKCNFLSFFSRRFIVLPILGDPGAGLSEWDDFSVRPSPGSPGMTSTVRTLPRDTVQLPGYGTVHLLYSIHLVMFNTPVFFL